MKDRYGRPIEYMRVSITDHCNLRCRYCTPRQADCLSGQELLTRGQIVSVCRQAAQLGVDRFKITGGEPLLRPDCADLIADLKALEGGPQVTLTTNGIFLEEQLPRLRAAGLDAVNISLDTLDADLYARITGEDRLEQALWGVCAALRSGIPVKINAVLMQGINADGWPELAEMARTRKLDVRFIELMPIGSGKELQGVSNQELLERMRGCWPELEADPTRHGNGPAVYCRIPGFAGSIGFISAIHGKFCAGCNRIRLTAAGKLKPCLCYGDEIDLRDAIFRGDEEAIAQGLRRAILSKPAMHCFEDSEAVTEKRGMAKIGG